MKEKRNIIIGGAVIGILAVISVLLGNPKNMGICVACFIRDTAGALGLHQAPIVQYVRPEILGFILGAFILSVANKEFASRGGSSPLIRFCLGFIVMIGALMFLGCPTRMVLRLAGGDFNAILGLLGFASGIFAGIFFLNRGFTLKRNYKQTRMEGYIMPIISVVLFVLLAVNSSLLIFSTEGPGSMHAPIFFSLGVGLIAGAICQRTRLCMAGGIRDAFLFKDFYLVSGFIAMLVGALIANIVTGQFVPGFADQPVAHTDGLWNFLGMAVCGWGSILLGGCPMRQLVLSGEGNVDSAVTILGLFVGAAFCHNLKFASSAEGPTPNGMVAVVVCLVILAVISYLGCKSETSDSQTQ